jgi:hydrogenase maturation protease
VLNAPRILVAGVGNVFLGDDGFGVEVARRLAERPLPAGVRVADFGVRGFDLACALLEAHDLVVLVDAVRRGGAPGTVYLLEVGGPPDGPVDFQGHSMDPAQVLRNVRALGGSPGRILLVGCEPEDFGEPGVGRMGLGARVAAAVETAVERIEGLLREVPAHA